MTPGRAEDGPRLSAAAEERYRAFVANSTEGIWRFDTDEPVPITLPEEEQIDAYFRVGYLAEANDAYARMYGLTSGDEMIGARVSDLLPRDIPENIAYLRAFIRSGYRLADVETVEPDTNGRLRHFSNTLTGVIENGALVRAWGTQRDITALRASEARYRDLFESHPQPMWVFDLETLAILTVNEAAVRHYGYAREEFLAMTITELRPAEDVPRFKAFVPTMANLPDEKLGSWRHVLKSGAVIDVEIVSTPLLYDGRPARVVAVTDVTERRAAERAHREAEERLRLALASGGMGAWDADLTTGLLTLSGEVAALYGRPREAVTLPFSVWVGDWLHPDERERIPAAFDDALRGGAEYDVRFRTLWPDGKTFRWVATRALITRDADGTAVRAVGYTRDVTAEQEREAEREALLAEQRRLVDKLREAGARQRRFLKEMLAGFTEGRLRLCFTPGDLPAPLAPLSDPLTLTDASLRRLRKTVEAAGATLALPPDRATDYVTACHEAAMNAVRYGGGGVARVYGDTATGRAQVWVQDGGPGIAEEMIHRAVEQGFTTGGFGQGLFLMRSCSDALYLLTGPGGTTIVLEMERTPPEPIWLTR